MKQLNIRPAYQYKLKGALTSTIVFYSIMLILLSALVYGNIRAAVYINGTIRSSFNGFGIAAMIFMFITGIVAVREDLRMFIQHGIGRKTTFLMQVMIAGSISLFLAIFGELLLKATRLIADSRANLVISDLYYMIFAEYNMARPVLIQHLESMALFLVLFICAYMAGNFVSLLFYRLNKIWTVIVAVSAPILIFVGLPILINHYNLSFSRQIAFIVSHPWIFIGFFTVISGVTSLINWLLLRRAPVKPAVG